MPVSKPAGNPDLRFQPEPRNLNFRLIKAPGAPSARGLLHVGSSHHSLAQTMSALHKSISFEGLYMKHLHMRRTRLAVTTSLCLMTSIIFGLPGAAQTQARPSLPAVQYSAVIPDENTLARLVWSTMIAVDNANRTGDYSVLYALTSPGFKRANSVNSLAANFTDLRARRVDVGRAIMMSPTYYRPPSVDAGGNLRLRGGFDYRPKSVRFDLLFVQVASGGWRINAISVVEMDFAAPR